MEEKNYIGSGWERKFDNGGSVINLSLRIEDIQKIPVDKHGCIKVTVSSRRPSGDPKDPTHSVYENSYVPQPKQGQQVTNQTNQTNQFAMPPEVKMEDIDISDMPF